jgi:Ca2+-binding RTX toxin-like protein
VKIESLESRLLLTGTYTTYDAVAKKLTVITTSSNDTIIISLSAGHTLSVSVNSVNDYNLGGANSLAVLAGMDIESNGGNDKIDLGTTTSAITTPTTISGGNGADTITGGAGADNIFGGAGNDSIDGGLGPDTISGGADNDTVSYVTRGTGVSVNLDLVANDGAAGEGDWVGAGTTDVESVMGGSGNDTLTGNSGGNYISGGSGADLIHGMVGSDTIVGCAGGDSLYGDDDADFIFAKDGEFDVIDGGPGIDAADVDSSPVEAPVPDLPAAGSAVSADETTAAASAAPVMGPVLKNIPKATSTFSTRRVRRRLAAQQIILAATFPPPSAAPLPAPPPDDNLEGKIDQATLPGILQPLDPYCKGQVLVNRDVQASVHVTGTGSNDPFTLGNDQFILQTIPGAPGVNITNNGGFTEWPLFSNPIFINGAGGDDALNVMGGNVSYTPGSQPGSGTIISDGHAIIFNGIDPNLISFGNVQNLTVITPGAVDVLHLGTLANTSSTELDGQSDGVALGTILLDNVQLLTIDCGKNETANSSNDSLIVDDISGNGPHVALLPGSFGSDTVTVKRPGLVLVNDPTSTPGEPTVTLNVNPDGEVTFAGPITRLATMNLAGHAIIPAGNNASLHPGGMNIIGGTLDVNDNSVVIDSAAGFFNQNGGTSNLNGGTLVAPTVNLQAGLLAGNGAITGNLLNAGTVAPGFSAGSISISGNYTQSATGTLQMQIGGTTAGTGFDQLSVGDTAQLNGTLAVSLINGFVPASGDAFALLPYVHHSGDFSSKTGLQFTGGVFQTQPQPLKYLLIANLAPVAADDSASTLEDKPVVVNVLGNDSDPDNSAANPDADPLVIDSFTQGGHGTVATTPGGGLLYSPGADFTGSETFTYTLRDMAGNTATATVSVTVTPVNDAPQFALSAFSATILENAGAQSVGVIAGPPNGPRPGPVTAVDEANQTLTFNVSVSNVTGNLAFSSAPTIDANTGKLSFTTAPDTHGTASFSIQLKDDGGTANGGVDTSAAQIFKLTVNSVAPHVLSTAYVHQNPANPFAGNYLKVRFSEAVSLTLADLHVLHVSTNQEIIPTSLQYIAANQAAIIRLPGTPADGNYTLTLVSAGITDAGGTALDGDGDGQAGGDYVAAFFQLQGDVNLDRTVGFADLVAVAQHYGSNNTLFADGDLNGDGMVSFADLVAVAQNYGNTLIPPVPAAAAG